MFDIVGTFLGVIHALLLQRRIRHKSGLYDDIDKLESRKTQEGTDESQVITSSLLRYVGQSKPPPLSRRYTDPWFKMVFSFGFIPLLSMGFGVLFLVITTLLFSVRAFEREVVIGCGSVLGGVVVLSFLPLWYGNSSIVSWIHNPNNYLPGIMGPLTVLFHSSADLSKGIHLLLVRFINFITITQPPTIEPGL